MSVSSKTVNEIVMLINDGWRPYNNQPEGYVYEALLCSRYKKNRPAWFVKGDKFLCISCSNHCALYRPVGFQPPLPLSYSDKKTVTFKLTPRELIKRKSSLTVHETAYCLNISIGKVYKFIYEGKLVKLKENPVRVKSEDIEKMMNDYDE